LIVVILTVKDYSAKLKVSVLYTVNNRDRSHGTFNVKLKCKIPLNLQFLKVKNYNSLY